jgi:hypothetical protein
MDGDDDDLGTDTDTDASSSGGFPYHSWIVDNGCQRAFGLFLDCLARRMIGERVLLSSSTKKPISSTSDETKDEKKTMTKSCLSLLQDKDAEKCLIKGGSKVHCVPKIHVSALQAAYEKFQDPSATWKEIIHEIFLVSTCSSIVSGQNAVLWAPVTDERLRRYEEMYDTMDEYFKAMLHQKNKNNDNDDDKARHSKTANSIAFYDPESDTTLVGEYDALIHDTLIELKSCGYEPGKCKLEAYVQALAYASILRCCSTEVVNVLHVYNFLTNQVFRFNISKWQHHRELLQFLARTSKAIMKENLIY